jgi:hypothetical protein
MRKGVDVNSIPIVKYYTYYYIHRELCQLNRSETKVSGNSLIKKGKISDFWPILADFCGICGHGLGGLYISLYISI